MTQRFHFYLLVWGLVGLVMVPSLAVASHVPGCTVTVTAQDTNGFEKVFEGCTQSFADTFEAGLAFQENGWHKYQYLGLSSNKVDVVSEKAHRGLWSLKSTTGPSLSQQKAALARQLLWFPEGSHFWMSVWVYIVGGTWTGDFYFFDLESTQVEGNPGRRLMLGGPNGDWLHVNSKRAGPQGNQTLHNEPIPFSKDTWVNVKMHLYVSSGSNGLTEVWQDGVRIITTAGQTIPSGLVYDWIELGTTANLSGQAPVVYLDDLVISKDPIP
ncbi:MAG: hypothetical protein E6K65_15825 [Nitrospirae bacterium]|nr:MAG: hypothetical protein E6K65_15825 [Nitrospirota bacterium]